MSSLWWQGLFCSKMYPGHQKSVCGTQTNVYNPDKCLQLQCIMIFIVSWLIIHYVLSEVLISTWHHLDLLHPRVGQRFLRNRGLSRNHPSQINFSPQDGWQIRIHFIFPDRLQIHCKYNRRWLNRKISNKSIVEIRFLEGFYHGVSWLSAYGQVPSIFYKIRVGPRMEAVCGVSFTSAFPLSLLLPQAPVDDRPHAF